MAEFPPQLFLVGAQKAGTTSLAFLLGQHVDIAVADPKEPGFFSAHYDRGLDWYRACFPQQLPRVLLDASTSYTMSPVGQADSPDIDQVPRRIKKHAPDARFIYVLRDPVERMISAIQHDRRAGRLGAVSLRTIAEAMPFYRDVSRYRLQMAPFLEHFPRDRFLFVRFNDLTADPVGVARRCIAFADLDPDKSPLILGEPKNAAFAFNGLGRWLFDRFHDERSASRFVGTMKRFIPARAHRLVKAVLTKDAETVDDADRRWLAAMFETDNAAMAELAGFRFYR